MREDHAFPGNRSGDEGYVLPQAAALHFFHRIHGGNAENSGAAFAGFLDDTSDLLSRDEGADGIVDGNEFGVVGDLIEGGCNGLLPRGAPFYHANRLTKFLFTNAMLQPLDFVGAGSQNDLRDEIRGGQAAKSV